MSAKPPPEGIVLLRRSSGRQEHSLQDQLTWALRRAEQLGVRLDASQDDLRYMRRKGLSEYKGVILDDAISGDELDRPGFLALRKKLESRGGPKYLFVYKSDRLGRPEEPAVMLAMENVWRANGITLVFEGRVALPIVLGESDMGEALSTLVDYHGNRKFLKDLSELVLRTKQEKARCGHWTGGRAPWGFGRFLVDASGRVIQQLTDGMSVRQSGCHVEIRPVDMQKLQIWREMLDKAPRWGAKRIANWLNKRALPSPDAGRTRTDQNTKHEVPGKWCARTVLEILRHPAIIAVQYFGRRSEGKHRRTIGKGHRLLNQGDRNERGKAKLVYNSNDVIIKAAAGYEPLYDLEKWLHVQEVLAKRRKSQGGIPRASDPGKYPLSCRVIDLTENCHEIMYARMNGQRKIYVCGLYVKSGCAECHNNTVDAEALLQVVMGVIRDVASGGAARETLIAELRALAAAEQASPEQYRVSELAAVRTQIAELTKSIATCKRRMASEENDVVQAGYRDEFLRQTGELQVKEAELAELERLEAVKPAQLDPEAEVQLALTRLDQIEELLQFPEARNEIRGLVNDLGIWIGLNFVDAVKGKKRTVRRLAGGIITFGSDKPPVKLFGPRNAEPSPEDDKVDPRTGPPEDAMAPQNVATTRSDLVAKQNAKRGSKAEYNTPSRDGFLSAGTVASQPSRQVIPHAGETCAFLKS